MDYYCCFCSSEMDFKTDVVTCGLCEAIHMISEVGDTTTIKSSIQG